MSFGFFQSDIIGFGKAEVTVEPAKLHKREIGCQVFPRTIGRMIVDHPHFHIMSMACPFNGTKALFQETPGLVADNDDRDIQ